MLKNDVFKPLPIVRNYNVKSLYIGLIAKQFHSPIDFLYEIISDKSHIIWGVCEDCAIEILEHGDTNWQWLAGHVNELSKFVIDKLVKKLPRLIFRANLGMGALGKHITDVKATISWLISRFTNELRNVLDKRYLGSISIPIVSVSTGLNNEW